jgi:putative ABC transport system permease protein
MITSDLTFLKIYPGQSPGLIQLGLIRVEPGVDPAVVRDALVRTLPPDVLALTVEDFVAREQAYWNDVTPVGYVFSLGVLLGFAVGSVIVAQILFADVTDHLPDYATLKAIGYGNGYLYGIVLWQSVLLGLLGYLPGLLASRGLCRVARAATGLPVEVSQATSLLVLGLTVAMCGVAGWLALGKVRAADPAEIF